jgi:hypothetical protein
MTRMARASGAAARSSRLVCSVIVLLLVCSQLAVCAPPAATGALSEGARYPYGGETFLSFVADSYREKGEGDPGQFHRWFDAEAQARAGQGLEAWIEEGARMLAAARRAGDRRRIAETEVRLGERTWQLIKRTIRTFSLDRGFEFTYTVARNERQCFLQSVLIAGLLKSQGADAGVAMIWKNPTGGVSNNGHAVTLMRLATGRDLMVDASAAEPFVEHQGMFVRVSGTHAFVTPTFAEGSPQITGYRRADGARIRFADVRGLDVPFVRSKFDFYRGERASGGVISREPSPAGLAASRRYLERSVRAAPQNPLALYMLGLTQRRQGRTAEARRTLVEAEALYRRFGWVPESVSRAARG